MKILLLSLAFASIYFNYQPQKDISQTQLQSVLDSDHPNLIVLIDGPKVFNEASMLQLPLLSVESVLKFSQIRFNQYKSVLVVSSQSKSLNAVTGSSFLAREDFSLSRELTVIETPMGQCPECNVLESEIKQFESLQSQNELVVAVFNGLALVPYRFLEEYKQKLRDLLEDFDERMILITAESVPKVESNCYDSLVACVRNTENCSNRGSCSRVNECFKCVCNQNPLESDRVWTGPRCEYQDISTQFWIIVLPLLGLMFVLVLVMKLFTEIKSDVHLNGNISKKTN